MVKLDLGCGISKREGYLGVDCIQLPGIDLVHDLNKLPYPFKDGEIDEVFMDNVLEHLDNPLKVMEEVYRICKDGAKITISVPYFRSFYATIDPTHRNFFGVNWFNYFDPDHLFHKKYQYTKAKLSVKMIEFDREFQNSKKSFLHRFFLRYAGKDPEKYERKFSHLYPLNSLTFHLVVVKP
jgi:predicted SAM-dependent methyltransferase